VIVDSSALLAILRSEAEATRMTDCILASDSRLMASANLLEAAMVAEARGGTKGAAELDTLVSNLGLLIAPFTEEHVGLARQAFRRFGKGQGHPARLNFGDCIAYALAKARGEPLLFKGNDFSRTDIEVAAY